MANKNGAKFLLVIVPFKEQVLLPEAIFRARFSPPDVSATRVDTLLPQRVI